MNSKSLQSSKEWSGDTVNKKERAEKEFRADFPRAILHVDGDAFFVACEVACNPSLKGKPVVTGEERRIASAMSYEAKALGVGRGMPVHEIRKLFPEVIIIPSHYRLYEIFSQRMYRILRRYTESVEWYSIDECFADITGLDHELGMSYEEIAITIQDTLHAELGISFSMGLSVTKVLAKVASKWKKPNGRTIIPLNSIPDYLQKTPLGKVWGIGPQTTRYLQQFGIATAQDFVDKGEAWLSERCAKPVLEIWHELCGRSLHDVHPGKHSKHKSLSSTETFMPPTSDPTFLFSELSRHVELVTRSARQETLAATRVSFFLKTRDFRYRRVECVMPTPTALPHIILDAIRKSFGSVYDPSMMYRATGVTLFGLVPISHVSQDLFSTQTETATDSSKKLYSTIDEILNRFGSKTLYLCSSLTAFGNRKAGRKKERNFHLPILGKVS